MVADLQGSPIAHLLTLEPLDYAIQRAARATFGAVFYSLESKAHRDPIVTTRWRTRDRGEGPILGDARLTVRVGYYRSAGFIDSPDYAYSLIGATLVVPFH